MTTPKTLLNVRHSEPHIWADLMVPQSGCSSACACLGPKLKCRGNKARATHAAGNVHVICLVLVNRVNRGFVPLASGQSPSLQPLSRLVPFSPHFLSIQRIFNSASLCCADTQVFAARLDRGPKLESCTRERKLNKLVLRWFSDCEVLLIVFVE